MKIVIYSIGIISILSCLCVAKHYMNKMDTLSAINEILLESEADRK